MLSILLVIGIIISLNSCKKDLDHDLNSNPFDVNYVGPEPVTIISFTPVYAVAQLRNILRIQISNKHIIKDATTRLIKDGKYLLQFSNDTITTVADFYALAGETHSYQVQQSLNGFKTKITDPKTFTMY